MSNIKEELKTLQNDLFQTLKQADILYGKTMKHEENTEEYKILKKLLLDFRVMNINIINDNILNFIKHNNLKITDYTCNKCNKIHLGMDPLNFGYSRIR